MTHWTAITSLLGFFFSQDTETAVMEEVEEFFFY